jgi:signal transduction histidine kinase
VHVAPAAAGNGHGEAIAVSVSDEGVGIPADELEAVFDKFVQSSKTKTGSGGTGLGLSICRQIIQDHGGRIWAQVRPGAVPLSNSCCQAKLGTSRPCPPATAFQR